MVKLLKKSILGPDVVAQACIPTFEMLRQEDFCKLEAMITSVC